MIISFFFRSTFLFYPTYTLFSFISLEALLIPSNANIKNHNLVWNICEYFEKFEIK